jgi:hypothetical protein
MNIKNAKNAKNVPNTRNTRNTGNARIETNTRNKPANAPVATTLTNKVKEMTQNAMKSATNLGDKIGQTATNLKQNIETKVKDASNQAKASTTSQDASKVMGQVQQFMEANSAISKFVAVVLSILVFYMLFNMCMYVMSQYLMPASHAKVLDGLVQSNVQTIVSANPNITSSIPILRSVNQNQGLEFTWNVWFFVKDIQNLIVNGNSKALLFSKGLATNNSLLGVCPGAYITPIRNSTNNNNRQVGLTVALSTMIDPKINNPGLEKIKVKNIPMNKWVHCAIRVQNLSVDIYINGVLTQRKNLKTLPYQNYYDTYIGSVQGFNGMISSLNYYAYALNYDQIQADYANGPNMKLKGQTNQINYKDYMAMNWYYN